jgi:outer membrane protein OmpA-like peptidoglycan-associated protein
MIRALLLALALGSLACEAAKTRAYDEEYRRLEAEAAAQHAEAQRYAAVIYFETGSADLDADDERELRWFADKMGPYPHANFDVQGFADSTGSEATNSRLSADRARSVAAYLHSLGIEPPRLHVSGFSSSSPAASNTTPKGRKNNRRVELTVR